MPISSSLPDQTSLKSAKWSSLLTSSSGGLLLSLFLARFFYVAESAGQGDTLWLVLAWFVGLLVWTAIVRNSAMCLTRPTWLDISVGLLVAGHLVSAIAIVMTTGDKRAAANFGWEWAGLGCGWFLLRQHLNQLLSFRREVLIGIVAVGSSVAGLGLYQHYIDFPRMAARYGAMFDRLRIADSDVAASIRKTLANDNVPFDGPGAILFEKRLRDSREPLGLFALANTFGGFLAVSLILAASIALSTMRQGLNVRKGDRGTLKRVVPWCVLIVLLGWCLLLTKSRTAWIGTAVGLAVLSFCSRPVAAIGSRSTSARKRVVGYRIAIAAVFGLFLAGWGLVVAGGLDHQVWSEAPKSLQYRLQYWSATLPMIRNHLVLGVGLGQFRWQYLICKLPEASEEISDPHNLFLDVAANGGATAFAGLLSICVFIVMRIIGINDSNESGESQADFSDTRVPLVVSVFAGIGWLGLLLTGLDDRLLIITPAVLFLYWALGRFSGIMRSGTATVRRNDPKTNATVPKNAEGGKGVSDFVNSISIEGSGNIPSDAIRAIRTGSLAAACGLIVHLCGAGGIEMPAIGLLLLVLVAAGDSSVLRIATVKRPLSLWMAAALNVAGIGLIIGLYQTALRPVTAMQARISAGDRLVQRGLPDAADAEYKAAAAADDWSVDPWRRRAELAWRKSQEQQFRSNESFLVAVRMLRESISRDPGNYHDDRRLGEWWSARWRLTKDPGDAQEVIGSYRLALARNPTSAALICELAFAYESAGNETDAGELAQRALQQDDINHTWGHVDRYLDERSRHRLEELAGR